MGKRTLQAILALALFGQSLAASAQQSANSFVGDPSATPYDTLRVANDLDDVSERPLIAFADDKGAPAVAPLAVSDAVAEEGAVADADADDTADSEDVWAERFRAHNTLQGATGGVRVVDAGSGPPGSFRLALGTSFFSIRDFFSPGDRVRHLTAGFSLSVSILEFLEVFGSVDVASTENSLGDPRVLQRLGDSRLGFKGFYRVKPWATVGGDFQVFFPSGVGDLGAELSGTSAGLRANASFDFRHVKRRLPLVMRANVGYFLDNTSALVEDTEASRYAALANPAPRDRETRHRVTDAERFALGINRVDRVDLALGIEATLKARRFYLDPLLEWTWQLPINRRGFRCPFLAVSPGSSQVAPGEDGCLDRSGVKAFPMTIVMGLRVLPPVEGLSVLVAAEAGLLGTQNFVRELAPVAPYRVIIGIGYAYDVRKRSAEAAPSTSAAAAPIELPDHSVYGEVLSIRGAPIPNAVVSFPGTDHSPVLTDQEGRFRTAALPPGAHRLEVAHPDYQPSTCTAQVSSGLDEPEMATASLQDSARCEMQPVVRQASLMLTLVDGTTGEAAGGVPVSLSGSATASEDSDLTGRVRFSGLAPGRYRIRADSRDYLLATDEVVLKASTQPTTFKMVLSRRPPNPKVRLTRTRLETRSQISFASDGERILPASEPLLVELADVIKRNRDLRSIEIQGHTDNHGSSARNLQLSQARADAVRQALIKHGVEASRLVAKGYGGSRPRVPNINARNRAQNRRVQFVILKRAD